MGIDPNKEFRQLKHPFHVTKIGSSEYIRFMCLHCGLYRHYRKEHIDAKLKKMGVKRLGALLQCVTCKTTGRMVPS